MSPEQQLQHLRHAGRIGRLVYGLSERHLPEMTGNHVENPTLDMPCREAFARVPKAVEVIGPVAAAGAETAAPHRDFRATR